MAGSVLSKISSSSWNARFDFTIIEPLQMKNPMIEVTPLLLAPHSSISLETNYQHDNLVYRYIHVLILMILFLKRNM